MPENPFPSKVVEVMERIVPPGCTKIAEPEIALLPACGAPRNA